MGKLRFLIHRWRYSLFLIFKNKPSLFQYVYLFSEGDGLLCTARVMGCFVYSILKETSHPGPLVLRREAWWDLLAQRYCFDLELPNFFEEKE